jgi:cell division protein FtsQ
VTDRYDADEDLPERVELGDPMGGSPAAAPPRRSRLEPPPRRRRPWWMLVLWGFGAAVLLATPLWTPPIMRRMDFFRLRRVEVVGTRYLTPREVLAVLRVDTSMSVWDPTRPMRDRVERHPEVLSAKIRRRLPGTIVVEVAERIPVALVPTPAGFDVLDERGVRLPIDPTRAPVDAPILAARDTALVRLLAELRVRVPALYALTSDIRREGRDQLLLRLGGLPVRTMADVTVDRLAELLPVRDDLGRRQAAVAELDLRYRDHVIARLQ